MLLFIFLSKTIFIPKNHILHFLQNHSLFLQHFYNSVSLATENYFYLLYTKYIKGIDSPESTLPILYYARPMVSIFVAMSAFFQPTQDDTIAMIILIVNTERTRTWTQ